jgi:uncharacterized protein DUF2442
LHLRAGNEDKSRSGWSARKRLLFSDGMVGDIDFSAERWTGVLAPLNDSDYFAEVSVDPEAGTVVWPDGIDLAPEPLYEQAKAHPLVTAA